jgi:hypothetical protein
LAQKLFLQYTTILDANMTDKLDVQALLKESKAEYRQLGKSGLRVSVPIFGCMSFGDKKWQPWVIEEEETLPLLKAAYDRGLTTWDTGAYFTCCG